MSRGYTNAPNPPIGPVDKMIIWRHNELVSMWNRHHHLHSMAMFEAWRLPIPRFPQLDDEHTFQATHGISYESNEPPQKKLHLIFSRYLIT